MINGDEVHRATEDELARQSAVRYAAATVHYVRRITRRMSSIDSSRSFLLTADADPEHGGKAPIYADAWAQKFFESFVRDSPPDSILGEVIVAGEEVSRTYRSLDRERGYVVVRSDPIDGTSNLTHCGDGFATVVTIEHRPAKQEKWMHLGGAIIRNDGDGISWSRAGVYRHDVVIDFQPLESGIVPQILNKELLPQLKRWKIPEEYEGRLIRSGATVAAHSSNRRKELLRSFPELVRRAEFLDFRSGSTSGWGLCNRRLGFVFELHWTTIHDSAHLYPFSMLGGHIVDHEYNTIEIEDIIEANADPGASPKVVPPYIAYADSRSLAFVRECLELGAVQSRSPE